MERLYRMRFADLDRPQSLGFHLRLGDFGRPLPMRPLMDSLWVGLGAALGANLRYWLGYICKSAVQPFPWPTLLINVAGSFALGAFTAAALAKGWGGPSRLFVAVGLCGGFTTFSTFALEFLEVGSKRSWKLAALYALASFALCVGACWAGMQGCRSLMGLNPINGATD